MYKMVLKITKGTWGKCGIKTVKYHNEEKNIIEFWHKMSDIKTKLGYSNIDDITLKRIRRYCGKKTKDNTKEKKKKKNIKHFLMVKRVFLLLKTLQVI